MVPVTVRPSPTARSAGGVIEIDLVSGVRIGGAVDGAARHD